MREGRWSVFLELRMDARNRVTNQDMEYWYMGSMEPRLEMQKNRMEEWTATGVYLTQHTQEKNKETRDPHQSTAFKKCRNYRSKSKSKCTLN